MRGDLVSLNSDDSIWIDIEAFKAKAEHARLVSEPEAYEEALELYRGDLLPEDRYEDWAIRRRDSLRSAWFDLLLEVAGIHEQRGNPEHAIRALQQIVESDTGHEDAKV